MDTQLDGVLPPLTTLKPKRIHPRYGWNKSFYIVHGFRCRYCQAFVHTIPELSGVQNRNHCPYCLWSRHLDLWAAGDRLSACKAGMQPIGLTVKPGRNKYASHLAGELMLVHLCLECNHVSINRIAADDAPDALMRLLLVSSPPDSS
ncbi:MAG: hypothetical protein A2136_02365, partial [Chloroflexi bacterium RBG_16_54_11]